MPPFSFEAKLKHHRTWPERLADDINRLAGSFGFFVLNVFIFVLWILVNTGQIPILPIIDPYPFTFLTMLVSLEAIFLSVFVLMSQNRASNIDSLREEIHLHINQIAEREITKALKLLVEIRDKVVASPTPDPELNQMLKAVDTASIEKQVEKELEPPPLVISELLENMEKRLHLKK